MILSVNKEIGSEFHKVLKEKGDGIRLPGFGHFVFSGRTAIETVLLNIPNAKKALLPSYCCESIIQPFKTLGIDVEFYPVYFSDNGIIIDIDIDNNTDIVFLCNYFGYSTNQLEKIKNNDSVIIIEDITHSLLSNIPFHDFSDFIVASLRKWFPVYSGGYFAAFNKNIDCLNYSYPPVFFIDNKSSAMELKREYLKDFDEQKKKEYLIKFAESNNWISKNYSKMFIDQWSYDYISTVDIDNIKRKRIKNARALYQGLSDRVRFLFPENDIECPLFVPILVNNNSYIRSVLAANGIYCPIHWPRPQNCKSNLYEYELSLVCDQRYNIDDMNKIVEVINKIL